MARRCLTTIGVIIGALWLPAAVPAADSTGITAVRARFVRDTIYHVSLNVADRRAAVFYGEIPLVACTVMTPDPEAAAEFVAVWSKRQTTGWQNVTQRHIWSGRQAISDTVIGVVASVSSVDPDLIRRVMPSRFDVSLTRDLRLRIMTPEGAAESRSFYEKRRGWAEHLNPFDHTETLELIVSPQDAQMLYYAFEPGAPVVLVSGAEAKVIK